MWIICLAQGHNSCCPCGSIPPPLDLESNAFPLHRSAPLDHFKVVLYGSLFWFCCFCMSVIANVRCVLLLFAPHTQQVHSVKNNADSPLIQRLDVESTLNWSCFNVVCSSMLFQHCVPTGDILLSMSLKPYASCLWPFLGNCVYRCVPTLKMFC